MAASVAYDQLVSYVVYASDLVGLACATIQRQLNEFFEEHPRAHSIKLAQTMTTELVGDNLVETIVVTVVYREPKR